MIEGGDAILRAVLNDGSIAMLPSYMTSHLRSGALVSVLIGL